MTEPSHYRVPASLDLPLAGANPLEAARRFILNTGRLSGRASRSEFWWVWLLNNVLVVLGLIVIPLQFGVVHSVVFKTGPFGPILTPQIQLFEAVVSDGPNRLPEPLVFVGMLYALVFLIPLFSLLIRRLHDANFSGWWVLLLAASGLGAFILMLMLARVSIYRGARFDPKPRPLVPTTIQDLVGRMRSRTKRPHDTSVR